MTFVLAVCVAVCFGVSVFMLLGRNLKGVAMGVFLVGHAANLSIVAMSGSPVVAPQNENQYEFKGPPLASYDTPSPALETMVDPLPQALILTAIVIGFAVMGFLLTLLVVTARSAGTLELNELAKPEEEAIRDIDEGAPRFDDHEGQA
ncbi:MAG: sodium:proton antiporter [Planctomycetota bacterium]